MNVEFPDGLHVLMESLHRCVAGIAVRRRHVHAESLHTFVTKRDKLMTMKHSASIGAKPTVCRPWHTSLRCQLSLSR